MASEPDRSDPAVRAAARLQAVEARDRGLRMLVAFALGASAVAAPVATQPLAGDGATVGGVVLMFLLIGLAVAVWPYEWTAAERRHRQLDAIWRELRTDATTPAPA